MLRKTYTGSSTTTCQTPVDNYITWDDGRMMDKGQTRKEARGLRGSLANPKIMRRIGCWNVRTMYSIGKTAQVTAEMQRYRISILGVSECRWSGFSRLRTQTRERLSCIQIEKMMSTKVE